MTILIGLAAGAIESSRRSKAPVSCGPRCMGSVGASGGNWHITFLVITIGDAGGGLPGKGARERESGPPAADWERQRSALSGPRSRLPHSITEMIRSRHPQWLLCANTGHSQTAWRIDKIGRVEMWRVGVRSSMSVSAPFVWRRLTRKIALRVHGCPMLFGVDPPLLEDEGRKSCPTKVDFVPTALRSRRDSRSNRICGPSCRPDKLPPDLNHCACFSKRMASA